MQNCFICRRLDIGNVTANNLGKNKPWNQLLVALHFFISFNSSPY